MLEGFIFLIKNYFAKKIRGVTGQCETHEALAENHEPLNTAPRPDFQVS
jgi:hypothetical protein